MLTDNQITTGLELADKATGRPWSVDDYYQDATEIYAEDGFPVAEAESTCIKHWDEPGIDHWNGYSHIVCHEKYKKEAGTE